MNIVLVILVLVMVVLVIWYENRISGFLCYCSVLSHVWLFKTPQTIACQASLSFTVSQILLKLTSTESVISSNHLIVCCPLLLLPSIFPSIKVFSNELALGIRWPKYWKVRQNTVVIKDLMFAGREILCLYRSVSNQNSGNNSAFSLI